MSELVIDLREAAAVEFWPSRRMRLNEAADRIEKLEEVIYLSVDPGMVSDELSPMVDEIAARWSNK